MKSRFVLPLNPNMRSRSNLIHLPYTRAKAHIDKNGGVRLTSDPLCYVGCETPIINPVFQGKKYRYFYAITSDIDDPISAGQVYKVRIMGQKSRENELAGKKLRMLPKETYIYLDVFPGQKVCLKFRNLGCPNISFLFRELMIKGCLLEWVDHSTANKKVKSCFRPKKLESAVFPESSLFEQFMIFF